MTEAETILAGRLADYKRAMEIWMEAIKHEESLVTIDRSILKLDEWEAAHFAEEDARAATKAAKASLEDALRSEIFGF